MNKQELIRDIELTKWEMKGQNPSSPHYKDLKRHLIKTERKLKNETKNY